jgi:hypothetical protein
MWTSFLGVGVYLFVIISAVYVGMYLIAAGFHVYRFFQGPPPLRYRGPTKGDEIRILKRRIRR